MKVCIVDTYYAGFLAHRHEQQGGSYAERLARLLAADFGTADYYSRHLRAHGIEAQELVANCVPLQLAWAREHQFPAPQMLELLPMDSLFVRALWRPVLLSILQAQIREARPDILYLQDLSLFPPHHLRVLRKVVKAVVGQIACPLPPPEYLEPYDLVLSSFPHYVERLPRKGVRAQYFRLGFEKPILDRVTTANPRIYECTFVGGISAAHQKGTEFLERIAEQMPLDLFGYGQESLRRGSPLESRHHGEVWGREMYGVLAASQITLNRHVDVAENYANNMRLYEATGMGALLITDAKDNLRELFSDKEVVTYRSPDEAIEMVGYYLSHPDERQAIAAAGQARTLREHTYEQRMAELAHILRHKL